MDMAQGGDFYLTLPSNASIDVYSGNKIWNYRTKLAKPIILDQPYQVGVIEVQYPRSWTSFTKEDAIVTLLLDHHTIVTTIPHHKKHVVRNKVTFEIPVGYYDSIPRVIKEINGHIQKYAKRLTMMHNSITNRVFFTGDDIGSIMLKGRLAHILGFTPGEEFELHPSTTPIVYAPHPSDIYGGCYNMFIYTDIVDYQRVGDSYVPLLRCINTTDDSRRVPTLIFDKPHYTSLSRSTIGDIEISIKNDQNHDIAFTYGKVVVKLHFRPTKNIG